MGFFKNIDIMLNNGDDDSTIAKWIRENAKDPNISKDESLDIISEMRHMWEEARTNHYRGFNQ